MEHIYTKTTPSNRKRGQNEKQKTTIKVWERLEVADNALSTIVVSDREPTMSKA